MKLSLACFAAAVAANEERFFTNKPEYVMYQGKKES